MGNFTVLQQIRIISQKSWNRWKKIFTVSYFPFSCEILSFPSVWVLKYYVQKEKNSVFLLLFSIYKKNEKLLCYFINVKFINFTHKFVVSYVLKILVWEMECWIYFKISRKNILQMFLAGWNIEIFVFYLTKFESCRWEILTENTKLKI